jgi:hypothetical protein
VVEDSWHDRAAGTAIQRKMSKLSRNAARSAFASALSPAKNTSMGLS